MSLARLSKHSRSTTMYTHHVGVHERRGHSCSCAECLAPTSICGPALDTWCFLDMFRTHKTLDSIRERNRYCGRYRSPGSASMTRSAIGQSAANGKVGSSKQGASRERNQTRPANWQQPPHMNGPRCNFRTPSHCCFFQPDSRLVSMYTRYGAPVHTSSRDAAITPSTSPHRL